jgi:Domain of unknown function (DUF4132)
VRPLTTPKPADEAAWARHEQRAGAVVDQLVLLGAKTTSGAEGLANGQAWREKVFDGPADVAASALMLLVRLCADGQAPWIDTLVGNPTLQAKYLSPEDAWLAGRAWLDGVDEWCAVWAVYVVVLALEAAAESSEPMTPEEQAFVKALVVSVDARREVDRVDTHWARTRLLRMLPYDDHSVDQEAIALLDWWADNVLPRLAALPDVPAVNALLHHLMKGKGSKPSTEWLSSLDELLANPVGAETLRIMLDGVLHSQPPAGVMGLAVDDRHVDLIRATAWASARVDADWVVATLEEVARDGIARSGRQSEGAMASTKVPNACIRALGEHATPPAVAALQRLADAARNNALRNWIAGALSVAAERNGLTIGQLVERTVPTGGLGPDGTCVLKAGDLVAQLHLKDDLKTTLSWQVGSEAVAKPPPDADATAVTWVKRQAKELKGLVAAERRRVQGLFATDRDWDLDDWHRYYLQHPVTSRLTRRLIWCFDTDGMVVTGVPQAGGLRTLTGHAELPTGGKVRLWHPATASTDEIEQWRRLLLDGALVQPLKQAFREVYVLTPAEQETGSFSDRFAAHIVGYQQLYALLKERAWVSKYLGPYDGGYDGQARHNYADAEITAVFEHFAVDVDGDAFRADLASTDSVWFYRSSDPGRHALLLDQVPPLVFSEAMRDVDLFVGVTSIALDPTWADRQTEPHFNYWLTASFAALTETAQTRRDVLTELLPKLKIADRVQVEDTYVRVRGNLAEYKVHLGSANVLIAPDDRYLCISSPSSGRPGSIMLPFEGDDVLSLILSKVVMLAADDKITDHTIVRQIQRRR